MRVVHGLESVRLSGVVLTIGNFDGVHRGHQAILCAGRRRADDARAQLAAMIFDPHPLAILTPGHVPPTLMPLDEKLRRLGEAGADVVVVARSNPELLGMTARQFIDDVIVDRFRPAAVVEGSSFGFGRRRQGDVYLLKTVGERLGFAVEIVQPVRVALGGHQDAVISSSLVRQLLLSGSAEQAAVCMGRPYALLGTVVQGEQRGRQLGFPTANIQTDGQLIPGDGVYAGQVIAEGRRHDAAISIGCNVTFDGEKVLIEAHLLDFDGDLYARPIRLEVIDWIRDQQDFGSAETLKKHLARDVADVRATLANHRANPLSHLHGMIPDQDS
ncbi:MAG TPA: riboflavin biosynthesis protein RibF [Phycisphaerae bacterium]|nr:riboflavin biosynthesis protein RibF [Phycisphaerae bacterium]